MKKIEIIERITDANGSISENILTSWEHKNQFIPEIIRFGELKIYLQERIVKKNDSDVHLSKYEYDILLLLAKSPGRIFGKEMVYDLVWNEPYSGDYNAPINTNEITEKLTLTTSWSPKTIQTLIKRLVSKKALSCEKQSRVFVYTPLVQEDEYIRQESNSFLKRYYNGNLSSMLASYLEDDKLSSTEIDNLRHLLSKHQK